MQNSLEKTFLSALDREGVQVYVSGNPKTVLFRRKTDKGDVIADWLDVYAPESDNLTAGSVLNVKGESYLIALKDHRKNDIYSHFNAVRCNQTVQLCTQEETDEYDKYGQPIVSEVVYADTPAYLSTALTELSKTAIGDVTGGKIFVLMPAFKINANTIFKCRRFNDNNEFVMQTYRIHTIDSTDTFVNSAGTVSGLLRLQIGI